MALSEMAKAPDPLFGNFLSWALGEDRTVVPCFTLFSIMELRQKAQVFELFVERFQPLPCVLLKGYSQLLDEEIAAYPHPSEIDPVAIAFTPLGGEGNQLTVLTSLLDITEHAKKERAWNEARQSIVDGMASLVPNYLPDGAKYTEKEVEDFVQLASFGQLAYHDHDFARAIIDCGRAVDVDGFPTLKAMTYTVFHKFYADRNRKPQRSDAFDVLIAAAVPYVEAVVTERHLADALRKTKRRDNFLDQLSVFTLGDFRDPVPE